MSACAVVVGGGISGLAVAHELIERAERSRARVEVVCCEAAPRPGGNIRSERGDGFLCEWGPNGFLDSAPGTLALVRRLGLEPRLVRAEPAAALRFIYRGGRLRRVPEGPRSFVTSDVLSLAGKLRLCGEPLARRRREAGDESVFDFAARRIGAEAAAVLVDAMVAGIYAGDSRRLSLEATFPKLRQMEAQHGSLFRALLARRREARGAGRPAGGPAGPAGWLTSFRDGTQELTDALARVLGPRLRLGWRVSGLSDLGPRGLRVHLGHGAALEATAVVLACPAWEAAPLVAALDRGLAEELGAIEGAPLAVVHLGYARGSLPGLPRGFGFLVPREQGPRMLGTLWASNIFPGRAPAGSALLTSMLGGAREPQLLERDDAELMRLARAELEACMGLRVAPDLVRIQRHARGIPQYVLGHPARLERIEERLRRLPGLSLCGNSYRGVSINACIEEAPRVADSVLARLGERAVAAGTG